MACNETVSFPLGMSGSMNVIDRYQELMKETLGEGSLYEKSKSSFYELFKDLEIDAEEKATIVAESISKMSIQMSATAMQTALQWAKEERDGYYTTALSYAQTMKTQADAEVARNEICKIDKEIELTCAKITSTLAGSIRENGMHQVPDGGCVPTGLQDNGLKYEQTQMVIQQTLSMGKEDTRKDAKNEEDIKFSVRQRESFEDSKRNHAANAASQMISGLIASEIPLADEAAMIGYWEDAMQYLIGDLVPATPPA